MHSFKICFRVNANGGTTEIITLDELLSMLGTNRDELETAEALDIEYLMDKKYFKITAVI